MKETQMRLFIYLFMYLLRLGRVFTLSQTEISVFYFWLIAHVRCPTRILCQGQTLNGLPLEQKKGYCQHLSTSEILYRRRVEFTVMKYSLCSSLQ